MRQLKAVLPLFALLSACDPDEQFMDCSTFDTDPSYLRTEGTFELSYDGWAGRAPKNAVRMHVLTVSEDHVFLRGCGYANDDDFWWVEAGIGIPESAPRPVPFGESEDTASGSAFLMSCKESDCVHERRRTWLDTAEGVVHEFDFTVGVLRADYVVTATSPGTRETGALGVHAVLTWTPE